ncbi:hypothetical protein BgiBS90_021777 [Biomphalaria glabrata]|nr:hypothetical protein BgiBS90_021777 [Biomphalaria glabrata]
MTRKLRRSTERKKSLPLKLSHSLHCESRSAAEDKKNKSPSPPRSLLSPSRLECLARGPRFAVWERATRSGEDKSAVSLQCITSTFGQLLVNESFHSANHKEFSLTLDIKYKKSNIFRLLLVATCDTSCQYFVPRAVSTLSHELSVLCPRSCQYFVTRAVSTLSHELSVLCHTSCQYFVTRAVGTLSHELSVLCHTSCRYYVTRAVSTLSHELSVLCHTSCQYFVTRAVSILSHELSVLCHTSCQYFVTRAVRTLSHELSVLCHTSGQYFVTRAVSTLSHELSVLCHTSC